MGRDRSGAASIEYGLIVSLIALIIVLSLEATATGLNVVFARLEWAIQEHYSETQIAAEYDNYRFNHMGGPGGGGGLMGYLDVQDYLAAFEDDASLERIHAGNGGSQSASTM